jgi:hypothetical protein
MEEAAPALQAPERRYRRARARWGRVVLARVWGLGDEKALKRRMCRRVRTLTVPRIDLNELEVIERDLMSASPAIDDS